MRARKLRFQVSAARTEIKRPMRQLLCVVATCAAALAILGCGRDEPVPAPTQKVIEEKIAPYTYPAPVKGHYKEVNIGEFDLVE